MSPAQRTYLGVVAAWEGDGFGEIDLQFVSTHRPRIPRYLESSTCKRIADALERRGFISVTGDGQVSVTQLGRRFL